MLVIGAPGVSRTSKQDAHWPCASPGSYGTITGVTASSIVLRARALIADEIVPDVLVEVTGDRISDVRVVTSTEAAPPNAVAVTGILVPGFVDVHTHGGGGGAFTGLDPDAAAAAARHQHSRGTTSLLASLVTLSPADLMRGVQMLADLADDGLVDGIHLEGPWLAQARCGAQDPRLMRDPDRAEVEQLLEAGRGHIRQVTLAPERDLGLDLVGWLVAAGVHAAIGHTTASFAVATQAVEAGADLATHLFNGMDPWHHREPGAVPALLRAAAEGAVTLELIADGTHLSDDTATTVIDLVGPGRVVFVSDAMAAAGVGDGRYVLGGLAVVVTDGVARLDPGPDADGPGSIAGGTSHVAEIVARAVASGRSLPDAVSCGTRTPARWLGLPDRGEIAVGARADLAVLGDDARLTKVMRAGRWLGA